MPWGIVCSLEQPGQGELSGSFIFTTYGHASPGGIILGEKEQGLCRQRSQALCGSAHWPDMAFPGYSARALQGAPSWGLEAATEDSHF